MSIPQEIELLQRDKYDGNADADLSADLERLASGEPLAYVIGWIPFLGLKIYLNTDHSSDSSTQTTRPLIPRPETEWWTEMLITHLKYKFGDNAFTLLDLCAGSGAIGLAVLSAFPNVHISFAELNPAYASLILKNVRENRLDESHVVIHSGDLFSTFPDAHFNLIATNPPYIPEDRGTELFESVTKFEPHEALFAGADGLSIIKRIITESPTHLLPDGEVWMECDISNIAEAETLFQSTSSPVPETTIHEDQYGRPRLIVAHFE